MREIKLSSIEINTRALGYGLVSGIRCFVVSGGGILIILETIRYLLTGNSLNSYSIQDELIIKSIQARNEVDLRTLRKAEVYSLFTCAMYGIGTAISGFRDAREQGGRGIRVCPLEEADHVCLI